MTTFAAPLHVKPWQSDTTVASINLSGSPTFRGIIQSGPNANTEAQSLVTQFTSVTNTTSGASSIRVPARAQIIDMTLLVRVSGSGNSQGVAVRIGTSGDATFFGQLIGSVQSTLYRAGVARNLATVSGANWVIGASDVQLHLDVSGVSTAAGAVDNFDGIFTVSYLRTTN